MNEPKDVVIFVLALILFAMSLYGMARKGAPLSAIVLVIPGYFSAFVIATYLPRLT